MIYFDNAATSLSKPPEVAQAVAWAIEHMGNSGRSTAGPAMLAAREVYAAREAVARMVQLDDPMRVAFTSGCTESISLLARMLGPEDHVIATEMEHNAVLRPLRFSGCQMDILPCDDQGRLLPEKQSALHKLFRPNTRFVFLSHGSNLTGNVTETSPIYAACQAHDVPLVLDVAQTLGCVPVSHALSDILCFTGHKGLYGPQGTGGLIVKQGVKLPVLKTGGTGSDSFSALQPQEMPDLAEAGTLNAHGLCGLRHGIEFVEKIGMEALSQHGKALTQRFYQGISRIPGVKAYGDFDRFPRLPLVSFSIEGMDSAEAALWLWENHGIATRAGSHCAPLLHRRLGTEATGLVRCSFSHFTSFNEMEQGIEAVYQLASSRRPSWMR